MLGGATGGAGRRAALLFALVDLFQTLVDAHSDKLHHHVRNAQPALELAHDFRTGGELDQDVITFAPLFDSVGQLAHAPLIGLVDFPTFAGNDSGELFDQRIDFFIRHIRTDDE